MTPGRNPVLVLATLTATLAAAPVRAETGDITLRGHFPIPDATRITAVWGYYDPASDREYALVGDWFGGFYVIETTDPTVPDLTRKVTAVDGFDLKVWDRYVYSCDGNASGNDLRITSLATPFAPLVLPATLPSCHSISISAQGVMYTGYPGVRVFDLAADPQNPDSLAHIDNVGNDATARGDRLYDFNGGALHIWDVNDPSSPLLLGSDDDSTISYYSGGDASADGSHLYVCDDYALTPAPDIVILDISNPAAPVRVGEINDPSSRVKRLYVSGNLMFVGYATAGFKVFDISNPAQPVLADAYDTSPYQTETGAEALDGACGAYPDTHRGHVYVADHPAGLFIFSVEGHTDEATAVAHAPRTARLGRNYPNPFNPSTTIEYETTGFARVVIRVYDVAGAAVRTLVDASLSAGSHHATWDGRDDDGRAVASGVYYCRLEAGGTREARRMVLIK